LQIISDVNVFIYKYLRDIHKNKNPRGKVNLKDSKGNDDGGNKNNPAEAKKEEKAQIDKKKEEEMLAKMTPKEKKRYLRKKKKDARKKKREQKAKEKPNTILAAGSRVLMTVRNVSGTYALTDGTLLPGFNQETRNLGMNSNTYGLTSFVFGQQGYDLLGRKNNYNVSTLASSNGWLVQNSSLNKAFTTTHTANLNLRASLEPMKDVIIELTLNRNYSRNSSEFYRWNDAQSIFEGQSRVETATLTYTNFTTTVKRYKVFGSYDTNSETISPNASPLR
jgi:cell surface protein SprA